MMQGAYTPFKIVNSEDVTRFEERMAGLKGVDYEPLLVAVQHSVRNGNHMYICNATSSTNPSRDYLAAVEFLNDGKLNIKELDLKM